MKEVKGNLWTFPADWVVVTTNCQTKYDPKAGGTVAIMGAGCALEAAKRFPELPELLAHRTMSHVQRFPDFHLITLPTKIRWKEYANIELIKQGVAALRSIALAAPKERFVMPRPGCGLGGRKWEDIRPLIEEVLPDNVFVISPPEREKGGARETSAEVVAQFERSEKSRD